MSGEAIAGIVVAVVVVVGAAGVVVWHHRPKGEGGGGADGRAVGGRAAARKRCATKAGDWVAPEKPSDGQAVAILKHVNSVVEMKANNPLRAHKSMKWRKTWSEEYQAFYFYNETSGETQWEEPEGYGTGPGMHRTGTDVSLA